jgi:SAM-dependent methyltransferase
MSFFSKQQHVPRARYALVEAGYATVPVLYEMFDANEDGVAGRLHLLKQFQRPWSIRQMRAFFPTLASRSILSIGEGLDVTSKILSAKDHASVTVLDRYEIDEELEKSRYLGSARLEKIRAENPAITYIDGLAGRPGQHGLPAASFDCIYSNSVLEHVPPDELRGVLDDTDRMLRPGGLQVHTLDFPVDIYDAELQLFKETFSAFLPASDRERIAAITLESIRANPMTFYEPVESFKIYWYPHKDRKDVQFERWSSFNIALRKLS